MVTFGIDRPPGVTSGAGLVAKDVERTPACTRRRLWRRQNSELPGAARQQHGVGADAALLGDHAHDLAGLDVETARGAVLVDRDAELARALGDGGAGERGLGAAVGRRLDAADPVLRAARRQLLDLGGASARGYASGTRAPVWSIPPTSRNRRDASWHRPGRCGESPSSVPSSWLSGAPYFEALHGERQFAQVAMLLAAPTPVPAGLLARDIALLEQGDRNTLLGECVRGGGARHAARRSRRRRRTGAISRRSRRLEPWVTWPRKYQGIRGTHRPEHQIIFARPIC